MILTYVLSCTISKSLQSIGQIVFDRGCLSLMHSFSVFKTHFDTRRRTNISSFQSSRMKQMNTIWVEHCLLKWSEMWRCCVCVVGCSCSAVQNRWRRTSSSRRKSSRRSWRHLKQKESRGRSRTNLKTSKLCGNYTYSAVYFSAVCNCTFTTNGYLTLVGLVLSSRRLLYQNNVFHGKFHNLWQNLTTLNTALL